MKTEKNDMEEAPWEWTVERLREDRERFRLTPEQLALASSGAKRDLQVIEQFNQGSKSALIRYSPETPNIVSGG